MSIPRCCRGVSFQGPCYQDEEPLLPLRKETVLDVPTSEQAGSAEHHPPENDDAHPQTPHSEFQRDILLSAIWLVCFSARLVDGGESVKKSGDRSRGGRGWFDHQTPHAFRSLIPCMMEMIAANGSCPFRKY